MHLVLKSSKAKGEWSFLRKKREIERLFREFGKRYGVSILSLANVGKHLHAHIRLSHRYTYKAFIRGLTSAITMLVTGCSRVRPLVGRFFDRRPFTRIVFGLKGLKAINDYVLINQMEGTGVPRWVAEEHIAWLRVGS